MYLIFFQALFLQLLEWHTYCDYLSFINSFISSSSYMTFTCFTSVSSLLLIVQSTPDNLNLQGKLKKVRVIGSSSYRGKIILKMT